MKKRILLLTTLALISNAKAENNFYLKGGMGLNDIKTKQFSNHDFEGKVKLSNSFPLIEAALGYKFINGIRIEALLDYYFLFSINELSRDSSKNTFQVAIKSKADSAMLNIYKDIVSIGTLTPFVGGGIGAAYFKEGASGYAISEDDTMIPLERINKKTYNFAYKLTLGTDIKLNDYTTAEISYNYFNLGKSKTINTSKYIYEIQNLTIGMRFEL
jgi:opacity protein-like surface antigen